MLIKKLKQKYLTDKREMSAIRNLKVTKRPRDDPLPDVPINFPPLQNLHLELMEIKDKLKPGLPLIPRSKPVMNQNLPPKIVIPTIISEPLGEKKDKVETFKPEKSEEKSATEKSDGEKHLSTKTRKKKDSQPPVKDVSEDDELVMDLGEDSEDEEILSEEEHSEKIDDIAEHSELEPEIVEEVEEVEEDIYAGLTPEEREVKEKEEYVWRFRILKKQYGKNASIPIPDWNEHSDLQLMKTSYERTIRELYLDDSVETYRTYLLAGWIVIEYACTQFIGIDLRGFTIQQTRMMHKYDRMLIELGEKSYTKWGSNLPVELRLLGLILFQAGIFYLGKVITDKFGGSVAELFRGFTGQPPPPTEQVQSPQKDDSSEEPKKKMRGPKIKAADIRNRNKAQ